jgi:hypothetical protein
MQMEFACKDADSVFINFFILGLRKNERKGISLVISKGAWGFLGVQKVTLLY